MSFQLRTEYRSFTACDPKKCLENDFHQPCLGTEIFLREHFLLCRPAVLSPTAILSSLFSQQFF